jgi:hypothetical protein
MNNIVSLKLMFLVERCRKSDMTEAQALELVCEV